MRLRRRCSSYSSLSIAPLSPPRRGGRWWLTLCPFQRCSLRLGGELCAPAVVADEFDEAALELGFLDETGFGAGVAHEGLGVCVSDGCDGAAVGGELLEEAGWFGGCAGGDEDRIVGGVGGPAGGAVADAAEDVFDAELVEAVERDRLQLGVSLDGVDLFVEGGEDGGLVAGAGADFEYALVGARLEEFGHFADHVWLRDGLAAFDGQGRIVVGAGVE